MMFYAHKEALVADDARDPRRDIRRSMHFLAKAWNNAMQVDRRGSQLFADKRYEMLRRYIGD